ncbi:MAG: SDR family oxidoreductase [Ignavibacteria bacterium]
MKNILITGASGTLGKQLCKVLTSHNIPYIAISRNEVDIEPPAKWMYIDLNSGEGLEKLPRQIDTVIHLASNASNKNSASDPELTNEMLKFSRAKKVSHFIYMSIVGIDKIPYPYYEQKLHSENLVISGNLPYTIFRATQFHQLIDFFLSNSLKFPIALLQKKFKFQPIDPKSVAKKLYEISQGDPVTGIVNLGGPEILTYGEMYTDWLKAKDRKAFVINLPAIGNRSKAFVNGYNTCSEKDSQGATWKEYLIYKYRRNF